VLDRQHYVDILNELDKADIDLNRWEINFLEDLLRKSRKKGFTLTVRQIQVITSMKEKHLTHAIAKQEFTKG